MTALSSRYPLVAVVAMAKNRVIGDGQQLLWHIPGDLPRVKGLTMGRPLIMGRRTYQSIGRPLPGRGNIVLTRQKDWHAEGVITAHSMEDAIAAAEGWIEADNDRTDEIIIFGGGDIYAAFLPSLNAIDLTEVDLAPEGDATFPSLNPDEWHEVRRQHHAAEDGGISFDLVRLERS
jgi:dihydrofolate reductase